MTADRLPKRLRTRVAVEKANAPLTPLLGLQFALTRTDAAMHIALYRQQGATDAQVARAWELWRESMAKSVTTIPARPKCVRDCFCLCHEGIGDVEHLGRPCYGKPGSTDVSDFDRSIQ